MVLIWGTSALHAQDPFFNQFSTNESVFNPSLVGYKGSLSFQSAFKSQWGGSGVQDFRSGRISIEESVPCSIFDYGFNFGFNEEGEGLLRRVDIGFRFAGVVPFDWGPSRHNLRIGGGLQWSVNRVDYTRLTFSDQLDPKYGLYDRLGIANPTGFVPPNEGRSNWFFTPSMGISHRILIDHSNPGSSTILYGIAIHNAFSIGSGSFTGNEESILGIGTKIPTRYSAFATWEFIPYFQRKTFISIRPLMVIEFQEQLSYLNTGLRISLNRLVAVGAYYHSNKAPEMGVNTRWLTFNVELGIPTSNKQRIELGFAYTNNLSGVRNYLGGMLEFSLIIHLASSPVCKLAGREDWIPYGDHMRCPTSAFTNSRRKMYENIWYK
nr:type IX secretion system membrane protein PorP/SprF [Saprospiraceae bacterium]